MILLPPRSTPLYSSSASDVYKRQRRHLHRQPVYRQPNQRDSAVRWIITWMRSCDPTASPNTTDLRATRAEIARILTNGLRDGEVPAPDRIYVAQVVAARTGLSQADADKRVSDVINQAKTALDNARKAAAKLSLWLTASLLIGAFAASLAATEGGYVRDNWNPGLTGR